MTRVGASRVTVCVDSMNFIWEARIASASAMCSVGTFNANPKAFGLPCSSAIAVLALNSKANKARIVSRIPVTFVFGNLAYNDEIFLVANRFCRLASTLSFLFGYLTTTAFSGTVGMRALIDFSKSGALKLSWT